ncbi:hypothetical protein ThidrDRAFT_1148 [Thiorhodococcus drewsii AZ1]|uniref:Uncharacterized protein n=1 Tax=Thiorhodococcus drewsii AZ1 TaxID=765913 RepID=G2DYN6_9GAMM|nr:hypothetical protein [Thiorhodococcus drewsii]EGV32663.1 hypothetical protein ThidrDRAFT_1148 [Thiorhodococcus drewsii AZ1]
MRWLWLISIGVTDVQFPVWTQDKYGCWIGPYRFECGRAGIRTVHEGLLALLDKGRIRFDAELPRPISREVMRDLRLDFMVKPEIGDFAAAVHCANRPDAFRIDEQTNEIPNPRASTLPLYCPKIEPLVTKAREIFADHAVSVLVLNTRRVENFGRESRDEPIASGPLVSRYLAERLGLNWLDSTGRIPEFFGSGIATWIDILVDHEAMEDPEAQGQVVARLNEGLRIWSGGGRDEPRILVTTSGGMPLLKPLIERVPATRFGHRSVELLDQPERGADAITSALSYAERVAERETLRFHCVEALRQGDYAGAYGLARRSSDHPWATEVRERLGSLLEFPGRAICLGGQPLAPFALHACQVEMRLCMGDIVGALLRLGPFIESAVWNLIASDARIQALGVSLDRANESLTGAIPNDHALFSRQTPLLEIPKKSLGSDPRYSVRNLTFEWPKWLVEPEGGQRSAALALIDVCVAYNREREGLNPRQYRNLLAHGSDQAIDVSKIGGCLQSSGLIASPGWRFGENFLGTDLIKALFAKLGADDLSVAMNGYLNDSLNRVIEG